MKKLVFPLLVFFIAITLCACSSADADQSPSLPEPSPQETTAQTFDSFVEELKEEMVDNRGTLTYDVEKTDDGITVKCFGEAVDSIFSATLEDYFANSDRWDTLRKTAQNLEAVVRNECVNHGFEVSVALNMVNSEDTQVLYYSVRDGSEIFNAMDVLPESKIVFHDSSTYKVGSDLDAGEYYILPVSKDKKVYMCVSSDSNGDDILENSFQGGPHYIAVQDGQYLEVSNGRFAPAAEFPAHPKGIVSGEGMYLVGKDIFAGEYKLTCDVGDKGYWCIYSSSSSDRSIVNNSLFEDASYVTVSDGQYLLVSSCSGILTE